MNAPKVTAAAISTPNQIIKLAILAVGGQGGGVLTNWVEKLARANGYAAQATSVAGVAQRTGTTVYYVEMAPQSDQVPVFSLAPSAGDVDVVIAAEMMEAGRAVMRGFVTPDRTTLIASTHRALAVSEKSEPGDGVRSSDEVRAAAEIAAQLLIMHDLEALAVQNGSVISASLFGALAASGALPFAKDTFEAAIRASGKGVEGSLRAFEAAYDRVVAGDAVSQPTVPVLACEPQGSSELIAGWHSLMSRTDALPSQVQAMARAGLRKVVDFQDLDYGAQYLDHMQAVLDVDNANREFALTVEAAKYIANAMAYDDVIRVADLKTRSDRFERIRSEMGVQAGQVLHLTEFMHPRAEEIAGLMPAATGQWFEANPARMAWLGRLFSKGRRLRSDRIPSFFALWVLGGLRGYRPRTLRHKIEVAHLERWLENAKKRAEVDYDVAVELIRARRLIKGYSDTHTRGLSKFDKVTGSADLLAGRADASEWIRRLHAAALNDEDGDALDGALRTIQEEILPKF